MTVYSLVGVAGRSVYGVPVLRQLYDLMAMVFKYQAEQCCHPRQLLMVTLNHLDSMARLASAPRVRKQVLTAHQLAVQVRPPLWWAEGTG